MTTTTRPIAATLCRPGSDRRPPLPALLMERVAGGDREAFAELYDQIAPAVYGLAHRIVRNAALADEVSQEVMVQVWRQASRFDPDRGSVRSWVFTITHRRAVDVVRREERRRANERAADATHPGGDVADGLCDAAVVVSALTRLPKAQREAIALAYLGGLRYREIAERLGVPLSTIKTRVRDGMQSLRRSPDVAQTQ